MFYRIIAFLCFFVFCSNIYSANTSENIRKEYVLKFHEAFVLQSVGKSTQAFDRFLEAFRLGTNAGEPPKKLQVIANLFYWYRQHGSCMKLFGKQPSFRERIDGEYCNCGEKHEYDERAFFRKPVLAAPQHHLAVTLAKVPDYQSEYGTNPRQAATVREFLFGVGEVIAGVFVCYASPYWGAGAGLVGHGVYQIGSSLHSLWTEHDAAMWELQKLINEAEAAVK